MGFRERSEWAGRMAVLIFVLASVAFLSAITTMRFAIQGREIVTPNLVDAPLTRAQTELQSRGLHIRVEDRVYSSLPEGSVVRQSPSAGTHLKIGEWVHAVVSLGQQKVTIPQLSDRSFLAAQIELLSEGLQAGEVSSAHLPEFPSDIVLQQDPAAGSTNASSPHVDMLVSLGPQSPAYVMPSLEGLPAAEAEQRLSSAGLKVGTVTPLPLTGRPPGTVTSQLPIRGARVEPGASIELQVAQ